jgi:DtxR family transcriptional regulator, Mn-dependent transcriptional regulator
MKPPEVERVEELCEEIWSLGEIGENRLGRVAGGSKVSDAGAALDDVVRRGLARVEGERVLLTGAGRDLAAGIVRRHRLAEFLFTQVLALGEEVSESTACDLEHVLSAEVTDSICTYLGHPPRCPHGKPIPRGACCEASAREVRPLVTRLVDLRVGEAGRIVFIVPGAQENLARIAALGVVPGSTVRLVQKRPSVVLESRHTTIALDPEIAHGIYVRPPGAAAGA